jgi:hypothetical protein
MVRLRFGRSQLGLGACLFLGACGPVGSVGESSTEEEADAGAITQEINETLNGVAELIYRRYYTHPAIARASYAMPIAPGSSLTCSGTMIGPNILMTASHCGRTQNAVFNTWRRAGAQGPSVFDSETFNCRYLLQTAGCAPGQSSCTKPDSDLMLAFCDPNADGINPGDKYGYLDFDPISLPVGRKLYSIWTNGYPNLPGGALIYSEGTVRSNTVAKGDTSGRIWSVPAAVPNSGLDLDMMGQSGCSGSPSLDPVTNKIVVGPVTTAPEGPGFGRQRGTNSILNYLIGGFSSSSSPGGFDPAVNVTEVNNQGLDPNNYFTWIDRQDDRLFDIQQDLEPLRGEAARGLYHLGFQSPRRNWLWAKGPGATIDANAGTLRVVHTSSTAEETTHSRLHLEADRTYRFMVSTNTTRSAGVSLGLRSNSGLTSVPLNMVPGAGWRGTIGTLRTVGFDNTLVLSVNGGSSDFLLSDLTLIRDGQMLNFDSHDERLGWTNGTAAPGIVVPDGIVTGTPNFAGLVRVPANTSNTAVLRNSRLALVQNEPYVVCFRTKALNGVVNGRVTVNMGSASVTQTFHLLASGTWESVCSPVLSPTSGVGSVEFRVESSGTNERGFYVDDISVLRQRFDTVSFDAGEDRRFNDGDWSFGNYKSECADGDYMSGVSATSIGMGPELRGHNAVCTQGGYALNSARTVYDISSADNRGDGSTGDWDPGYIKAECARDEVISGISQIPGKSISPTAIRCSKLAQVQGRGCQPLFFDSSFDVRNNFNSGDWAPGYSKNECRANQVLQGVSRRADTGEIHAILCCDAYSAGHL